MRSTRRSRRTRGHRRRRHARLRGPTPDAVRAPNAESDRPHRHRRVRARETGRVGAGESLDVHVPLDARAPATARSLLVPWLRDRVAADVLDSVQLLLSELVSNSVRHSGASAGDLAVVRVRLTRYTVRLEVEDRGRGGVIAPRRPNLERGDGFGLNVVQALSHRWGPKRVAAGGTLVWAQLARASLLVPATPYPPADASVARPSPDGIPSTGGAARTRQPRPAGGTP
jgi:anti-sigma regulatory factor (Ser/Thr protein kinase)